MHEVLTRLHRRLSQTARRRGATLRKLYSSIGLVHFGSIHQHDDDINVIRGFTASLTHQDLQYAVGDYNGYSIRMVDRYDMIHTPQARRHLQQWVILEIDLHRTNLMHLFFMPTGTQASEYSRLFAAQPHMQPLNSMILSNKSPEFHGRFQILARASHAQEVTRLFSSPIIVGIASRFWPHGIEIEHGKLLIYITEHRLTKTVLESTLASALWLAETIDETAQ